MKKAIRWMAMALVLAAAGCAPPVRNEATGVAPAPDALVMANACSAPANEGCTSCQVSCPADMVAYCAPGHGRQVLGTGGIYVWQCWVQPQCSCSYPQGRLP